MPDILIDRTTYIQFDGDTPISTGILSGSMRLSQILYTGDMAFGVIAAPMFEITIFGIEDITGQKIEVYQIENNQRKDIFVGRVESAKIDNDEQYRDIVAYGEFYFLSRKNVADWYNSQWTSNNSLTMYQLFVSLMIYCGLECDSSVTAERFVGTVTKANTVQFDKISFKDMVRFLTEFSGLIPYINNSGKVAIWCPKTANSTNISGKFDVQNTTFKEFVVDEISYVEILGADSTVISQKDYQTGDTRMYSFSYNPLIQEVYKDNAAAQTIQNSIFAKFKENVIDHLVEYRPCDIHMIVSDTTIKIGDKLLTEKGYFYVAENILSDQMLIEQEIICTGNEVQDEVEDDYDPSFAYLDQKIDETAENLQEQIDNFQPSEEFMEQVGIFNEAIANASGLKVITITDGETGAVTRYFYAPDTNGSIANSKFVFTMKSTGFAWTDDWKGNATGTSEGSTVWSSGITANGNMILKMLTAYKISADMIESGAITSGKLSSAIQNQLSEISAATEAAENASEDAQEALAVAKSKYGTCDTVASANEKIVVCAGFKLFEGATINVKFTYRNETYQVPGLNVNSTGIKYIRVYGAFLTPDSPYNWPAGSTVQFVYDGAYWVMTDSSAMKRVAEWCASQDITYINGGKIYTGSISADKIAANSIDATKIQANTGILNKLGVEDAEITGQLTFKDTNTWAMPKNSESGVLQTVLNEVSQEKYNCDYSNLKTVLAGYPYYYNSVQIAVAVSVVVSTAYARSVYRFLTSDRNIIIENAEGIPSATLGKTALWFWESGENGGEAALISFYGKNSAMVNGSLSALDLQVGGYFDKLKGGTTSNVNRASGWGNSAIISFQLGEDGKNCRYLVIVSVYLQTTGISTRFDFCTALTNLSSAPTSFSMDNGVSQSTCVGGFNTVSKFQKIVETTDEQDFYIWVSHNYTSSVGIQARYEATMISRIDN